MIDAKAHAHIVIAGVRGNRLQPVMARVAAALLDANDAGLQVDLIVNDDDVADRQLVEAHGFPDRAPAFIHIGGGLQEDALLKPDLALRRVSLKPLLPGPEAVAPRDLVNRHETDVMAVA